MNRLFSGIAGRFISFSSFRHGWPCVVMAALLLSAGWAQGETCMQLTPSGWKEREDRKEDYLLTGLKEKIGILPLLNGGIWKPEDIVPPEGNVACGDKFLLPESKGGRERWILMDREGNECAHLDVYLFESERMARKEFILERESFSQLGDLVVWGKDGARERGTWCMYRLSGKSVDCPEFAVRGNLGIDFWTGGRDFSISLPEVEQLFDLFLDRKNHIAAGEELNRALEKKRKRRAEYDREKKEQYLMDEKIGPEERRRMDPWYGMPELCRTIAGFGREQVPVDLLRHEEVLSEELQIPNVHEGCMHFALFHGGIEHGLYLGMFQELRHGAHAVLNPVTPWDDTLTRSDFIEILEAHARSRKEAMELLLKMRFYDPLGRKRDVRAVAAETDMGNSKKTGLVGDFDMFAGSVCAPGENRSGAKIASSVYFLRRNTAVMLVSSDPRYSVLSLARILDDRLLKYEKRLKTEQK